MLWAVCRHVDPSPSVCRLLLASPSSRPEPCPGCVAVRLGFSVSPSARSEGRLATLGDRRDHAGVKGASVGRGPSGGRRRRFLDHPFVLPLLAAACDRVEQHRRRDRDGVLRHDEPGPVLVAAPTPSLLPVLTADLDFQLVRKVTDRPAWRPKNERPGVHSSVSPAFWPWNERC